jgi:ECF sigma factor
MRISGAKRPSSVQRSAQLAGRAEEVTNQGALPLDIPFEPLGWFAISSAALRAARTAMRTRNENRIRVLGRIAVQPGRRSAEVLGVSVVTVKRDWKVARAWLAGRLQSRA